MRHAKLSLVWPPPEAPAPQPPAPREPLHWPSSPKRLGLKQVAMIAGVSTARIGQWHHQGAFPVKPMGRGKVRAYSLWDALRCAIIAEMQRLGLPITGPGEALSAATESWIWYRGHNGEDLSDLQSIAFIPTGDDWDMLQLPDALIEHRSFVVIGVANIVEGVVKRYQVE